MAISRVSLSLTQASLEAFKMLKIASIIASCSVIVLGLIVAFVEQPSRLSELDLQLDKWWGKGSGPGKGLRVEGPAIRKFQIDVNNTIIENLKQRIKDRRPLTKPLQGIHSEYGFNTDYLNKVLKYWSEEYDFKKRVEIMNQLPHFRTRIQGLDLHFVRVKPNVEGHIKVLPLLMLHGWPSSSIEFYKVIPMLTSKREGYDFVFEVIAPDLPGFGFSEGTNKPGLSPVQMGIVMRNLMMRLGHYKFYIQGGDWGSQAATHMATIFSDQILGLHTNMPISSRPITMLKTIVGSLFPSLIDRKHWRRLYPLSEFMSYVMMESGYFHIQATKPDTIGIALTDSPVGLAGYVMEKMAVVSNRDQLDTIHGGLANLDIDDVLDTVTIIWATNCIVTATRIYKEGSGMVNPEVKIVHNIPTPVPTAAINFKYEVLYQPDWMLRDKFQNLVRTTTVDFGGHFAALQNPKELADDIFDAADDFLLFHNGNKKVVWPGDDQVLPMHDSWFVHLLG